MKKIGFSVILCLSLSACETIDAPSWPSLSSLNPFGEKETVQTVQTVQTVLMDETDKRIPVEDITNTSVLDTESKEFDFLNGDVVVTPKESVINKTINEIEEPQDVVAMIEPKVKPSLPKVVKAIQADPISTAIKPVAIVKQKITQPSVVNETPIFTDANLILNSANGCPAIQIMPSARSITYFENEISGQMVARAIINEIRVNCDLSGPNMKLDLDILMKGTITNKGRFEGQRDQEAFMTFPYFISVLTPQGLPVDKKIMATAMRFRPSVDHLDHAEKITQTVIVDNMAQAANYKIIIGYQLTRKQLEYNRAQTLMRTDNIRVSPDTTNAAKRSLNPFE